MSMEIQHSFFNMIYLLVFILGCKSNNFTESVPILYMKKKIRAPCLGRSNESCIYANYRLMQDSCQIDSPGRRLSLSRITIIELEVYDTFLEFCLQKYNYYSIKTSFWRFFSKVTEMIGYQSDSSFSDSFCCISETVCRKNYQSYKPKMITKDYCFLLFL